MSVRQWGAAVATAAAAAMAFAFACEPFAGDDPRATPNGDAAPSTSSSSGEAAAPPQDAGDGAELDGGGPPGDASQGGECFDFSNGANNGFTLTGSNAQAQAGGIRIIVEGSTFNMMQRTFHRDGGIASTRVGVDMTITGTVPTGTQFADTLLLYYGLPADYQKTPQTAFELVDKGDLNVDIWGAAATSPYQDYKIEASKFPYGHTADALWIDSVWTKTGRHVLSSGATTIATLPAQLADQTKNDFTIRLGGQGFNGVPATTLLVRSMCVLLR